MAHEEIINMITIRDISEDIRDTDRSNMRLVSFGHDDEKVYCTFNIFSYDFLQEISDYNSLFYEMLTNDNLTFQEKLDYFDRLRFNNQFKDAPKDLKLPKIVDKSFPLVYKKNNICKFSYISVESSSRNINGKFFIK